VYEKWSKNGHFPHRFRVVIGLLGVWWHNKPKTKKSAKEKNRRTMELPHQGVCQTALERARIITPVAGLNLFW